MSFCLLPRLYRVHLNLTDTYPATKSKDMTTFLTDQALINNKNPLMIANKSNHQLFWNQEEKTWVPNLFADVMTCDAHWVVDLPVNGVYVSNANLSKPN